MAEPTQYKFELAEVAKNLLEKQGISQGKWKIGVNFTVAAVEAGPTPEGRRPSMVISVDHVLLTETDATDSGPLVVDAK